MQKHFEYEVNEIAAYHQKYTSKINSNFPPYQTQQKVFQCTFFCLETMAVALHKKVAEMGFAVEV